MNKLEITKKLASKDPNYNQDPKFVSMLYKAWWSSWKNNEDRSFKLTDAGYEYFTKTAEVKFYEIRFPRELVLTNKMIIDLDRYIDSPYYIKKDKIYVTGEKIAVQLVLFDGDLTRFGRAKRETKERNSKDS
jgi:hypothetical protein